MNPHPYTFSVLTDAHKEVIISQVCEYFKLSFSKIKVKTRKKEVIICRKFIYYYLFHKVNLNKSDIGRIFLQTPANIKIALDKTELWILSDAVYKNHFEHLNKII